MPGRSIGNVIWFIVAGIWLAIGHVATGIALCITIIGIPLGIASFKMVPISLFPLGKDIVAVGSRTGVDPTQEGACVAARSDPAHSLGSQELLSPNTV